MNEEVIGYVTRYALTEGILERKLVMRDDGAARDSSFRHVVFYYPGDWFRTREEALVDAERRRVKKIASLRKQVSKLEKLFFT